MIALHSTLEAQVGPWVIDSINLNGDLRTGTQYIGNWASRASSVIEAKVSTTSCSNWMKTTG